MKWHYNIWLFLAGSCLIFGGFFATMEASQGYEALVKCTAEGVPKFYYALEQTLRPGLCDGFDRAWTYAFMGDFMFFLGLCAIAIYFFTFFLKEHNEKKLSLTRT